MRQSRKKNRTLDITGLLLFDRPFFLQIIEGPTDSINQLIADILADERHRDVDIIYVNEELADREFARWNMGCKILGNGLPEEYRALDERAKHVLRKGKPHGETARQLLLDFRAVENSYVDI